jgi:hypothetical protein
VIKAFLSHSSEDKESYVRNVVKWLGKDNVICDEFTFEEGEKTLHEILKGLDTSQIFVLFISDSALESPWVKREITEAKDRLDQKFISKIYPIIISDDVTYKDKRIPDWLRDNYNIKPITKASVAARRIHAKLREISWEKHPELKKRQNIFVGRNEKSEEFEQRIHDFDRQKPLAIISSGITGVGRRTFMHRALIKTNITEPSQKPSAIYLDRNVSIEDFILKLNDLGITDLKDEVLNLTTKDIPKKISLLHHIMDEARKFEEIIYIIDEGCLINYKREISDWFIVDP